MKKLFSLIFISILAGLTATAQLGTNTQQQIGAAGGVYNIIPGGTNGVAALTTNTYGISVTNVGANGISNVITYPQFIFPCQYQKDIGLEIIEASVGTSTNAPVGTVYAVSRSYDNAATFETTPFRFLTNAMPTAANGFTNVFLYDLAVTNATHIAIVSIGEQGTNQNRTNIIVNAVLKNSTQWHLSPPSH
jgi:hypothetical protein